MEWWRRPTYVSPANHVCGHVVKGRKLGIGEHFIGEIDTKGILEQTEANSDGAVLSAKMLV